MKHELLAPAGNIEAGYAALHYGADAVYLGLTKFSARAGAENFTADELDEFTAYAHSLNRKVFVALNTILTEAEVQELPETFEAIRRARVDALIIQDLGVFYLAKRMLPEVELHASTQMAVHNAEGAKFLQSVGFKRVVLARELSVAEIKAIAAACPGLDLEVFVHGALCYSYSGQCLFSALEYGKSANRGRCTYPCRGVFSREESVRAHLFSMKDLALEEAVLEIPALSLKIEGRKKSPLYVAAVTNYYRHILDGRKKDLNEAEDIKQIFSRPWCRFHFNGKNKDVTDENFVGHRGLVIGKVERVGKGRLGFKTSHTVARYDGVQIDSGNDEKPFGFGVKALFVNGKPAFEAKAGQYVELELPEERPHLSVGAPVYLASSTAVKGKYDYAKPKPGAFRNLTPLEVVVEIGASEVWAFAVMQSADAPVYGLLRTDGLTPARNDYKDGGSGLPRIQLDVAPCNDYKDGGSGLPRIQLDVAPCNDLQKESVGVSVSGVFDAAKDVTKVETAVRSAFAKTGGTAFVVSSLEVRNPEGRFVPVSVLNELRRKLVEKCVICPTDSQMEASRQSGHVRLCTLPSFGGHPRSFEQIPHFSSVTNGEGAFEQIPHFSSVTNGEGGGRTCLCGEIATACRASLAMTREKERERFCNDAQREAMSLRVVDVALDMDVDMFLSPSSVLPPQGEGDKAEAEVWFRLPQICRNMAKLSAVVRRLYERGVRRFVAENYYAFELLRGYKDVQIGAGSFLYVMNSYATAALAEFGVKFATLALESSPENMREVAQHSALPLAQVIKAYPPLFTSAVCIRPNACKDCKRGVKTYQLKKDGKTYTAVSKDCQIQLFADVPYEREVVDGVCYVIAEEK